MKNILIVLLLVGSIGFFVDYEVNKIVKSTNEISTSIYTMGKISKSIRLFKNDVNKELESGIAVMLKLGGNKAEDSDAIIKE